MNHYLQSALESVETTVGPLSTDRIGCPVAGRWSIAEIVEHLTLAYTLNAAAFEKALESGTLKIRPASVAQRVARFMVVELGLFPRVASPEMTRPRGTVTADRSVVAAREALVQLDATMDRIVERFGERTPSANHPYFAGMGVYHWRKFHWRHTLHHMRQVRQRCAMIASA